jgi:hypothetical protein
MPDWDFNVLQTKFEEMEERLKQYQEPIDRFYQTNMQRINHWTYYPADFERELQQVRDQQDAQSPVRQEANEFIGLLCAAYLKATREECEQIRALFAKRKHLMSALLVFANLALKEIKSPTDVQWVRLGLAAISIENCGADFRDGAWALEKLYTAAEKVGVDPRPYLNEIAELSSDLCPYPHYPNPFSMRSALLTCADAIEKGRIQLKSQASQGSFWQRLLQIIKRKLHVFG